MGLAYSPNITIQVLERYPQHPKKDAQMIMARIPEYDTKYSSPEAVQISNGTQQRDDFGNRQLVANLPLPSRLELRAWSLEFKDSLNSCKR